MRCFCQQPQQPLVRSLTPCGQVQFDFNRNKYFDTKEAVEYGIIDQVWGAEPLVCTLTHECAHACRPAYAG